MSDDAQLIALVAGKRDRRAFAELYDRCAPRVYHLACRLLNNTAEAEDVVQRAFLSLWENAHRFDGRRGGVGTWLYAFVRNGCYDVLRRRKTGAVMLSIDGAEGAWEFPDGSPSHDDAWDENERRVQVTQALRALPDDQRKVIEAAHYEGLTQQEIADRTGQPLGTVKTRMRLGMIKLAQTLKTVLSDTL